MSSILRALKRVENEAPPQDDSQAWPRPIDSKKAINSKIKKAWLYNKLVSALVIILVIVAASWLVISQRQLILAKLMPGKSSNETRQNSAPSKAKEPVYHAKIKTPPAGSNKDPQSHGPAIGKQSGNRFLQNKTNPAGSTKPRPGLLSQKKLERPQIPIQPKPAKKKASLKNAAMRVQPVRQHGSPGSLNPAPTHKASTAAFAQTEESAVVKNRLDALSPINDATLKLQAIAWSGDASRRMVVINNRIVREGESVDGFSITKIRTDDVIVSDGSNSWRLEFKLKQ